MMRNVLLLTVAVALLAACGEQKTEQTAAATQPAQTAPDVAAPAPMAAPVVPATPAAPEELSATPPESARCLELVAQAAFTEAVPVCVRAAGLDPDNTAVQEALATARAKSATAASTAADEAARKAASEASGTLGGQLP